MPTHAPYPILWNIENNHPLGHFHWSSSTNHMGQSLQLANENQSFPFTGTLSLQGVANTCILFIFYQTVQRKFTSFFLCEKRAPSKKYSESSWRVYIRRIQLQWESRRDSWNLLISTHFPSQFSAALQFAVACRLRCASLLFSSLSLFCVSLCASTLLLSFFSPLACWMDTCTFQLHPLGPHKDRQLSESAHDLC